MPRSEAEPSGSARRLRVLMAGPGHAVGGQAHAARSLLEGFRGDPSVAIEFQPIDPRLPGALGFLTRWPVIRSLVRPLLYSIRLWRHSRQADLIHAFAAAHTAFLFGALPAILVSRLRRVPLLLNYHDGRAEAHLRRWGRPLRRLLLRPAALVVPSHFLAKVFAQYGIPARVIPNVVDAERFSYREHQAPPRRLLSLRSLEPLYAVENTIQAFALLKREYPDLVLELYGAGPEESRLRAWVARLQVADVRFHGVVSHAQIPELLASGGIVVNSSRIDNQPLFILEAFASGLPVVSTAAGGIPDLIRHGENGLLAPLDDPAALAREVGVLLADPPRGLALVRRAKQELTDYSWPVVREQWRELYTALATGS